MFLASPFGARINLDSHQDVARLLAEPMAPRRVEQETRDVCCKRQGCYKLTIWMDSTWQFSAIFMVKICENIKLWVCHISIYVRFDNMGIKHVQMIKYTWAYNGIMNLI
jgi:hypothetical protein